MGEAVEGFGEGCPVIDEGGEARTEGMEAGVEVGGE